MSVLVETFGTEKVARELIEAKVSELVDLRPAAIIDRLDLRRPIYSAHAAYGHMGREDLGSPWEKLDLVEDLAKLLK